MSATACPERVYKLPGNVKLVYCTQYRLLASVAACVAVRRVRLNSTYAMSAA